MKSDHSVFVKPAAVPKSFANNNRLYGSASSTCESRALRGLASGANAAATKSSSRSGLRKQPFGLMFKERHPIQMYTVAHKIVFEQTVANAQCARFVQNLRLGIVNSFDYKLRAGGDIPHGDCEQI